MRSIRNLLKTALAVAAMTLAMGQTSWASFGDFTYVTVVTPAAPPAGVGSQVTQGSETPPGTFNAASVPTAGTDITVGTVTVTDLAPGFAYTDNYTIPINVKLTITDQANPGTPLTFNFTGTLTGVVTSDGVSSTSVNFNNPFVAASQSQTVGAGVTAATYTVSIIPSKDFTAPGAPPIGGPGLSGTYSFHVFATPSVPEPASLTLMGIGVVGAVGFAVRRRRAK